MTSSRYFAVIKPMSLAGVDRRGKVMLCTAWTASVICSTPQAIIFHEEAHPNVTWYKQCVTFNYFKEPYHEVIYSMLGMMMLYAIPLICFLFCYTSIYMELYRKSKKCVTGWQLAFNTKSISIFRIYKINLFIFLFLLKFRSISQIE